MKVMQKILIGLSILFMMASTTANDRYVNYEGQGEWYSSSSNPAVRIFIKGSSVYVESINKQLNLPATRLKQINSNLLNEYTNQYIRIQDFNRDSFDDIGILKSVSYGGGKRCYAVFNYLPSYYTYKTRATKTICVD